MKILVHDYAGHPFQVQLSRALAARGHRVTHAYATALQTPRGELAPKAGDAPTFRLAPVEMDPDYARYKYSFLKRRRMEVAYGRAVAALVAREKPDVVLSSNTPTETQTPIFHASQRCGAAFFYWLQDFYSLAVDKLVRKKLPVVGAAIGSWYKRLDRQQLRGSAGVVAITDDFAPILREDFGVAPERITTIPNWAPLQSVPVRPKENAWAREHGLADKWVYLYTGTLGLKHNPALLLELARRHAGNDAVRVVVISEGLGADWLREQTAAQPLPNLVQMGYQPFEAMPDVLGAGDALIGVLEEDAGVFSVPSKILTYLCAQRPILLAAPDVNLATRTVEREGAGLTMAPSDHAGFQAAAERLLGDSAGAAAMGRRGRAYAERHFRIDEIASRFEMLFGVTQPLPAPSPRPVGPLVTAA